MRPKTRALVDFFCRRRAVSLMTRWVYMTCLLGVVLSLNSGVGHPDQQNASRKLINGVISFRRVSRTGTYARVYLCLSL